MRGVGIDTLSMDPGISKDFAVHHVINGAGRYGTAGRGIVKVGLEGGMAISQSFYRTFGIPWFTRKEGARLRIGFQMYNAPNHSNKANPTTALNSPVYGRRTNERTGGDTVGFMRTMAFQARVDF